MKNVAMLSQGLAALLAASVILLPVQKAHACGGLVQPTTGTVSQSGQLAILSLHDQVTDVVLTLDVPEAGNDFGVIVPVPAEPTIDDEPVSTTALASLEELTRPVVGFPDSDDTGGGCACGVGDALAGGGDKRGVIVGDPVNIGPVTAQWISGANGDAVGDWLATEGFVLPDGGQALVDEYVNDGLSFLAFKRNDTDTGAARVGVHFTLDGDHRAYALKMTRLGAGETMSFTIFVAAAEATGPDFPYGALRIADLDGDLAQTDYPAAVKKAVDALDGKAFVVETATPASDLAGLGFELIIPSNSVVTRLSTVADPANLDADVSFTARAPGNLEELPAAGVTTTSTPLLPPPRVDLSLAALLLALCVAVVARRRDDVGAAA
jgi:hypothetical protein